MEHDSSRFVPDPIPQTEESKKEIVFFAGVDRRAASQTFLEFDKPPENISTQGEVAVSDAPEIRSFKPRWTVRANLECRWPPRARLKHMSQLLRADRARLQRQDRPGYRSHPAVGEACCQRPQPALIRHHVVVEEGDNVAVRRARADVPGTAQPLHRRRKIVGFIPLGQDPSRIGGRRAVNYDGGDGFIFDVLQCLKTPFQKNRAIMGTNYHSDTGLRTIGILRCRSAPTLNVQDNFHEMNS
jgi:hypothetical protein